MGWPGNEAGNPTPGQGAGFLGPRGRSGGPSHATELPQDPDYRAFAAQSSFMGRIGQPDEIADVVAFLVSEEARWVTGQNIQASGAVV